MFAHRSAAGSALLLLTLLSIVLLGRAVEPAPVPSPEEKILKEAGLAADNASLLAFFRERTLDEKQRKHLADLVRQLGDDSFPVRERATQELLKAGRPALSFLRSAQHDPDPEIASRVARCLKTIDNGSEQELTLAAARLLAVRRPSGAIEVLLAYLPSNDEETVEEAVLSTLLAVGLVDGKPAANLTAALTDKEPPRRAAAAHVIGRAAPQHRKGLDRLLGDADARVRFRAAAALVRAGEKPAVNTLLNLLADAPLPLAAQAEDLLWQIAGEQSPQTGLGNGEETRRRACREAWEKWWNANEGKVDLTKRNFDDTHLGLTIVCDCDVPSGSVGRVWACRSDGKPRWQIDGLGNPADVQVLPGDRYLIAECQGKVVTERDRQGKIFWSHSVGSYPVSCQRLANGNTFIATYNELLEVTRDGKSVFSRVRNGGSIYCAQKLANGNILFAEGNGAIIEMDAEGKEVRNIAVGGFSGWAGVEPLPNGRYLAAQYVHGQVVEVDATGKVFWQCKVQSPAWATRLRNGNTLVASTDARCMVEFDPAGKELRKYPTQGRPFRVRRY